jgi:site-specific recombinase
MTPIRSSIDASDISLSDRMDEWISRQHTLLVVAQETQYQSDQHKVVEMTPLCYAINKKPSIRVISLITLSIHMWPKPLTEMSVIRLRMLT